MIYLLARKSHDTQNLDCIMLETMREKGSEKSIPSVRMKLKKQQPTDLSPTFLVLWLILVFPSVSGFDGGRLLIRSARGKNNLDYTTRTSATQEELLIYSSNNEENTFTNSSYKANQNQTRIAINETNDSSSVDRTQSQSLQIVETRTQIHQNADFADKKQEVATTLPTECDKKRQPEQKQQHSSSIIKKSVPPGSQNEVHPANRINLPHDYVNVSKKDPEHWTNLPINQGMTNGSDQISIGSKTRWTHQRIDTNSTDLAIGGSLTKRKLLLKITTLPSGSQNEVLRVNRISLTNDSEVYESDFEHSTSESTINEDIDNGSDQFLNGSKTRWTRQSIDTNSADSTDERIPAIGGSLAKRKLLLKTTAPIGSDLANDNFINGGKSSSIIYLAKASLIGSSGQANNGPATNDRPFASMLISSLINTQVKLPCDISPPTPDDSVALILWYKDDSVAPIYTLDARKESQLEKARVTVDDGYSNRATFTTSSKPAHLILGQLKLNDEGDYRCRVDFRRGRTVNTIISLRVIIPPDDVRIVSPSKPNQRLEGHIGPLNEGQELVLVCLAHGGKPRPQITWRHDYSTIDETLQRLDKDGTSNELRIPALTRSHLLSKFTCQANNSQPINTEITLDLNLKPQDISVRQLGIEPLIVGQNATFECLSTGSRPPAILHWLFQGLRHQPPTEFQQQQSVSRLTLTLQRSFNQQPLTCVAENERLMIPGKLSPIPTETSAPNPISNSIKHTLKLDVQYPPQLSIRLEPLPASTPSGSGAPSDPAGSSNQQLDHSATTSTTPVKGAKNSALTNNNYSPQQGNDIYLTCQLDANPRPNKAILWRHNGRLVSFNQFQQQQSQQTIVMSNQSLVLRKISPSQSGSYTCESSNLLGSNSSSPLQLNVRHAPVCATDDIIIYEATIGQTLAIDCQVVANPPKSVHFSWFKSPLETNLTDWIYRDATLDEQIDDSSQSLKIRIKDRKSFGQFKCKAKNDIGLQQRACLFQIIEAQVPKLRHNCHHQLSFPSSLTIACEPNDHLKSDDFELSGGGAGAGPGSVGGGVATQRQSSQTPDSYWQLGLDAAKNSMLMSSSGSDSDNSLSLNQFNEGVSTQVWRARLVHPPRWLLAEVYKVSSSSSESELISYVIVSSSSQLATIKSLVETNQVFKSNPKGTYYVKTKPLAISGANISSSSSNDSNDRNDNQLNDSTMIDRQRSLSSSTTGSNNQQQQPASNKLLISQSSMSSMGPNLVVQSGGGGGGGHSNLIAGFQNNIIFIEDPSIQLASKFRFDIPNLEPESRYKLMIFGQNVASRTRDWISIRADTLGPTNNSTSSSMDSASSAGNSQAPLESRSRTLNNDSSLSIQRNQQLDDINIVASGGSGDANDDNPDEFHKPSKFLVMRSDNNHASSSSDQNSGNGNGTSQQLAGELDQLSTSDEDGDKSQVGSRNNSSIGSRFLEQAARKWPLVQNQMGQFADKALVFARQRPLLALPMAIMSGFVLLFILIWLITQLTQKSSHNNDKSSANGVGQTGLKSIGNQQNVDKKRRLSSSNGDDNDDDIMFNHDSGSDSMRKSPPDDNSSPNNINYNDKNEMILANGHHHSTSNGIRFSSSASSGSSGFKSQQMAQQQQVFAICSTSPRIAYSSGSRNEVLLDGPSESHASKQPHSITYMLSNGHQHQHQIGSLDRRQLPSIHLMQQNQQHDAPIYLSTLFTDANGDAASSYQQNQFNSIDRSSGFVQQRNGSGEGGQMLRKLSVCNPINNKLNQRVAFNLSPYELPEVLSIIPNNNSNHNGNNNCIITKGTSDSSGSNSNQTGDSGHESPPTTNTLNGGTGNNTTTTNTLTGLTNDELIAGQCSTGSPMGELLEAYGTAGAAGTSDGGNSLELANGCGLISEEAYSLFTGGRHGTTDGDLNRNGSACQLHQGHLVLASASSLSSSVACSPAISEQLQLQPNIGHQQDGEILMLVHHNHNHQQQQQQQQQNLDQSLDCIGHTLNNNHQMATSFCGNNKQHQREQQVKDTGRAGIDYGLVGYGSRAGGLELPAVYHHVHDQNGLPNSLVYQQAPRHHQQQHQNSRSMMMSSDESNSSIIQSYQQYQNQHQHQARRAHQQQQQPTANNIVEPATNQNKHLQNTSKQHNRINTRNNNNKTAQISNRSKSNASAANHNQSDQLCNDDKQQDLEMNWL